MSDTVSTTVRDLLQSVVNAPTWEETRQIIDQNQALLLTEEADTEFASWIARGFEDNEIFTVQDINWYRSLLQHCRFQSIDATFDRLPEPRPLNKALKACIAGKITSVDQVLHHFPEIRSAAAIATVQKLISQTETIDQKKAKRLTACLTLIELANGTRQPASQDMIQLLSEWILLSGDKSKAMLRENAERLLSYEAFEALDMMLSLYVLYPNQSDDMTDVLLQHRAILKKAYVESIDAAYDNPPMLPSLKLALQRLPDELCAAAEALVTINSPEEFVQLIEQHPIWIEPETSAAIEQLLDYLRQIKQENAQRILEERYLFLQKFIELARAEGERRLEILLRADRPEDLEQVIAQNPALSSDRVLQNLAALVTGLEQDGNKAFAQILRLRLNEIQRIQRQQEQVYSNDKILPSTHHSEYERSKIEAKLNSIGIGYNLAPVTQININIEHYVLEETWLQPGRQTFPHNKLFVGREKIRNELEDYLKTTADNTPIVLIYGMGGIGKTYLAIKLAIELEAYFTGGVILINLDENLVTEEQVQPQLRELASYVFNGQLPIDNLQPEQVAAWLQKNAPPHLLVIFDNVCNQEALIALNRALPSNVARIVTTRDSNIAWTLEGKRIRLDPLEIKDGLALLEARLECAGKTEYEKDLGKITSLLGGHPLALDIAIARIKYPHRISTILRDLENGFGRGSLDGLKLRSESRNTSLEKSLSYSYQQMTKEDQQRFRALGVFATEAPITVQAAAAVWGTDDLVAAQIMLSELVDLSLLDEKPEDSASIIYYQHSLLHVYAQALLDKVGERDSTSWRLAAYYERMASIIENSKGNKDFLVLDFHIKNLQTTLSWSIDHEPALFVELMTGSCQFLRLHGHLDLFEEYMPEAVAIAESLSMTKHHAYLLRHLGEMQIYLGNLDQSRAYFDEALPLFRSINDQLNEASVLRDLGELSSKLEHFDVARAYFDEALLLFRAVKNLRGEAHIFLSLGILESNLGQYDQARTCYEAALPLYLSIHDQLGEAQALFGLGTIAVEQELFDQALDHFSNALVISRPLAIKASEAQILFHLGRLEKRLNHYEQASAHFQDALPIYHNMRNYLDEANVLYELGILAFLSNHLDQACTRFQAALPLYHNVHEQQGEFNTLIDLGMVELQAGHLDVALSYTDPALSLLQTQHDKKETAHKLLFLVNTLLMSGEWIHARRYFEQVLVLLSSKQYTREKASTLLDFAQYCFALGHHKQVVEDIKQAIELFYSLQDLEQAHQAERTLAQIQTQLEQNETPSPPISMDLPKFAQIYDQLKQLKKDDLDTFSENFESLRGFIDAKSAEEIWQSVEQYPELLGNQWFSLIETLIDAQKVEKFKQQIRERFDVLKYIGQVIANTLSYFANANWYKRRQLLQAQGKLLLNEQVEPIFDRLMETNQGNSDALRLLEEVRVLLRRCRAWGVDPAWHFNLGMHLGDSIDIPIEYEPTVMQIAILLARREEHSKESTQAMETMEKLLHSLSSNLHGLFRADLSCDLADVIISLPEKHPLRKLEVAEAYYLYAIALYQASNQPIRATFIQRSLSELYSEQGRYGEASKTLETALQNFRTEEIYRDTIAWTLPLYAHCLERSNQLEEALDAFDEAIKILPVNTDILYNRAETLIFTSRLEEAAADLARAVELDGNENSPYLWFRRAQLAIARGDADLAEQMLEQALARDPAFDVLFVQAQSAWLRGDLTGAQEKLRQALKQAHAGDRAALRREMERLLEEHMEVTGNDTIRAIITEFGQQET